MEVERSTTRQQLQWARWALLFGNFVIGCGVMVVGGTLNDLIADLRISVTQGGHLIAVAAVMMGVGAPVMAALVGGMDRRRLLTLTMLWYALGHALCAWAPDYHWLWPLRAITVLSAAVFTPQAAATMGFMSTPAHRGRAITFVFMGWAVASVAGMPLTAWVGERLGWRVAMGAIAVGSVVSAALVWRGLPKGIRPPAMSLRAWRKIFQSPLLLAVVAVTLFQSAGQYSLLAYAAPYYKTDFGASPEEISAMFGFFGGFALLGNLVLNRVIDRTGPAQAVTTTLGLIVLSLLLWPLAPTLPWLAVATLPWALSGFATNSGQQARLGGLSPRLAPALMSLNTSAIYLGHAIGASAGAWVLAHPEPGRTGFHNLHWVGVVLVGLAWGISAWAARKQARADARGLSPAD